MSESIEEKAKRWCIENGYSTDQDVQGNGTDDVPLHEFYDNFIEVYNLCLGDMRERTGEEFEEWMKSLQFGLSGYLLSQAAREAWQAATLSAEKRNAEEIRVRDEMISELENELKMIYCRHSPAYNRDDFAKSYPIAAKLITEIRGRG